MRSFNLADLFELVADAVPEREAMAAPGRRLTYGQLEERANRLAHALTAAGVGRGDHVGLLLHNGTEYIEAMLAAFKIRAVPVNVNYRYVEGELLHLFADADLVALVLHGSLLSRVAAVASEVPALRSFLVVEDEEVDLGALAGAYAYDRALAESSPDRDFGARSADDVYCAYTGGTTGMPKGVMWRQADIFFAAMGGGDPMQQGDFIPTPEDIVTRIPPQGMVMMLTPPFMHVSAHWTAFATLYGGGKVIVPPPGRFDAPVILSTIAAEKVNMVVVVGDAMARPLVDELRARPDRYDTSSLFVVGSGGAVLSPTTKEALLELLPHVMVIDGFGASETGTLGTRAAAAGGASAAPFTVNDQTAVFDENLVPVEPGSGVVGMLARRGHIPLGYYKDPEKTASTFIEVNGERWVVPGDMATVEADGSVVLLGRGSVSINTGGEKVFPEEVESALKAHPAVEDVVVVGLPDERWGERVVAVVQLRPGAALGLDDAQAFCRNRLAGYKIPREIKPVDEILRSPTGKPDYRWARDAAARA